MSAACHTNVIESRDKAVTGVVYVIKSAPTSALLSSAMHWADWANLIANISSAVIALGGFAIAIHELRRARGAAEGTRLLTLSQSLRSIERDLDESLRSRKGAIRAMNDWRSLASDAHGILARAKAPQALLDTLADSRQLAAEAKADLQTRNSVNVPTATYKSRSAIARACDDVSQFLSTID